MQLDVQRLSSEAPPLRVLELPGLSVPCQDSRVLQALPRLPLLVQRL